MTTCDQLMKQRMNAIYGLRTPEMKITNEIPDEEPTNDEWILIKGYKGTDKNMRCRGFQYELGKQYDMPEGSAIKECESGFHLCKELEDAVEWCKQHGLTFDAVNENLPEIIQEFGKDSRKIFANRYIDDRAWHPKDIF